MAWYRLQLLGPVLMSSGVQHRMSKMYKPEYYTVTSWDSGTNDTSFESPISQLLELIMKVGVLVSYRLPCPLEWKMPLSEKIISYL